MFWWVGLLGGSEALEEARGCWRANRWWDLFVNHLYACSVHHWLVLKDKSTLPSVAWLHVVVGHPVVVISLWLSKKINRSPCSKVVGTNSSSTNTEPLLPREGSSSHQLSHSWAGSENRADTEGEDGNLKSSTSSTTLSSIKLRLRQKVLIRLLNDTISIIIGFILCLPARCVIEINWSDLLIQRGSQFSHFLEYEFN